MVFYGAKLKWHEAHLYKLVVVWMRIVLTFWFNVVSSVSPISWLFNWLCGIWRRLLCYSLHPQLGAHEIEWEVMVASHCYSQGRWWLDILWITLIRIYSSFHAVVCKSNWWLEHTYLLKYVENILESGTTVGSQPILG